MGPYARGQVGTCGLAIYSSGHSQSALTAGQDEILTTYHTISSQQDSLSLFERAINKLDKTLVWISARPLDSLLMLLLVGLACFVPGQMSLPPIDRDEPRFAQASRQMVQTGDYLDIRFQEDARHKKPIGIYWLQAGLLNLLDAPDPAPIWMFRVVSLMGALGAVLAVYWLGLQFATRPSTAYPIAFISALLITLTILLNVEARLAKTDAVLFLCIVIAQTVLAKAFLAQRDRHCKAWLAAVFWLAFAIGVLIKGPVLPLIVVLTALCASLAVSEWRWIRRLRPLKGFLFAVLVILPWFIAIGIKTEGAFFIEAVGKDLLAKIGEGQESHGAPPGTYLFAVLPFACWPLAAFAFLAFPFTWKTRHDRSTLFLLSWIIPGWLLFEFTATKLPHYILPLLPALSILAARAIVHERLGQGYLATAFKGLIPLVPVALALALPVALFVFEQALIIPLASLALFVSALLGLSAFVALQKEKLYGALACVSLSAILLYGAAFGSFFPKADILWISPRLAESLKEVRCDNPELATLSYREPSLVLLTRTDLFMTNAEGAARFMQRPGCRVTFMDITEEQTFLQAMPDKGQEGLRLVTRVKGINLNGGDQLDLGVWARGEKTSSNE
jgi:4-amino-4-deoxy-L-arabinose transferase-like glycosyltransferase